MINKEKVGIIFSLLVFGMFCWAAVEAQHFRELARFFPYYIAMIGVILTFIDLVIRVVKMVKNKEKAAEPLHENMRAALKYLLIIVGYLLLIYLAGIFIGTAIYLFAFLYFETKFGFLKSILAVAIVVAGIMLFGDVMHLYWPKSILF